MDKEIMVPEPHALARKEMPMCAVGGDPVGQGERLRKALRDHIRSAIETGPIHRFGKHHFIEVDETIKPYLPEGTTFDYAESVLRSAGFVLDARSTPDSPGSGGPEYKFGVNAFLGYPPDRFEGVQCVVALRPAGPYDYGLVHRIFVTCCWLSLSGRPHRSLRDLIDQGVRWMRRGPVRVISRPQNFDRLSEVAC